MPTRINKLLMIWPILLLLSGCAVTHAPPGWLPNPEQLQTEAYGSWIVVHYTNKTLIDQTKMGELIAVSNDSLYVLRGYTLVGIAKTDVTRARLVEYNSHVGALGGWTFLGMISTISHGWWLVLTAPVLWLIPGTIATISRSRDPIRDYPQYSLDSFAPFARFPQGLPEHLNRKALKPKPVHLTQQ